MMVGGMTIVGGGNEWNAVCLGIRLQEKVRRQALG